MSSPDVSKSERSTFDFVMLADVGERIATSVLFYHSSVLVICFTEEQCDSFRDSFPSEA
jgi:hypothetical protein